MFSVIIPLYNKAPHIAKTIQSVFDQTCQDFELIVVNDGSTDNSLKIVQKLNHLSIIPIRIFNQANAGASIARNNGVKSAQYDYIAFLDADDWWEPTFLEEMKILLGQYSEAGIYGSSYYIVKNNHKRIASIGIKNGFVKGLINYCNAYAKNLAMPLSSSSVIVPKSLIVKENGFKPKLKLGEDFDLWIRLASQYPVAFLNKPLANYNQDVELKERAVGAKLYEPHEHMMFSNYGNLHENPDFCHLYERLALYSLLPYYMGNKNKKETNKILNSVHWENHEFKYRVYYKILPKWILRFYFAIKKKGSKIKSKLIRNLS